MECETTVLHTASALGIFERMDSKDRIQFVQDLHELHLPMSREEQRLFDEFCKATGLTQEEERSE